MTAEIRTFEDAARVAKAELGCVLFTVTVIAPGAEEIARVFSTHPEVYPVGGRKRLDPQGTSPRWLEQVIGRQQAFVGESRAAVREFFIDSDTIESLGCGSIINTPVVSGGRTVGSINFLGPEGTMTADGLPQALRITEAVAPLAVAALAALPT